MHQVKVESFEGPLDLLLQLIEQNELDITRVSLSDVTEQYIKTLEAFDSDIPAYELADFLFVAAKLLLIKSKALMPYLVWEEEEDEVDLERQLRMYKEYYEASKIIQKMISRRRFSYARERFLVPQDIGFQPPKSLTQEKLSAVFREIIEGLTPVINLPKNIIRRTVNLQEKIRRIKDRIFTESKTSFQHILKEAKDRTEVIVSFLAILELIKQRDVRATQGNMFEDIIIEKM